MKKTINILGTYIGGALKTKCSFRYLLTSGTILKLIAKKISFMNNQ